jgi:hypothetical protein
MNVILVGGGAAVVAGSRRLTRDVDFEARPARRELPGYDDTLARAVNEAMRDSGVDAQFTGELARWSELGLPPYRSTVQLWRRFGGLVVNRLDPAIFVVTKLSRGLARDYADLVYVAKVEGVSWRKVARACGMAVQLSPPSTRRPHFIHRIKHLFNAYGRDIWGSTFAPHAAIAAFESTYGRRLRTSR